MEEGREISRLAGDGMRWMVRERNIYIYTEGGEFFEIEIVLSLYLTAVNIGLNEFP